MNHMKDKKSKAKRTVSGVITVEMTYIVPMIFFIFVMIIYTVFYYHDKNILIGAAGETAVVAAQMTRKPETEGQSGSYRILSGTHTRKIDLISSHRSFY